MKKVILIFGNITFNHFDKEELKLFKTNNEQKALVHSIEKVIECVDRKEADNLVDELENVYESWLMPSVFKGEIVFECEIPVELK